MLEDLGLGCPHAGLVFVPGVIVAEKMQDAMHDEQLQFGLQRVSASNGLDSGARQRENHVAQVKAAGLGVRLASRKGKHVGGGIDTAVKAVEFAHLLVVGEHEGQIGVEGGGLQVEGRLGRPFEQAGVGERVQSRLEVEKDHFRLLERASVGVSSAAG